MDSPITTRLSVRSGVAQDPKAPVHGAPEPEYQRIALVAQRYDLSVSTLYRMSARGDIRMVRVGSRSLVDVASVRTFLAALPNRKGA